MPAPTIDPATTSAPGGLARALRTVALSVLFNSLVAGVLIVTLRGRPDVHFVYAQAIGLSVRLFIEIGRRVLPSRPEAKWPRGYWGAVLVGVSSLAGFVLGSEVGDWYSGIDTWALVEGDSHFSVSLLVTCIAGAIASFYFFARGREQAMLARAAATSEALAEARLKLLQSQLEPHMLFNTLGNLRALIAIDPQRAEAMLDRLVAFLRATLAGSLGTSHSLADEFRQLDNYLELMKIRLGDRLQATLSLPDDLAGVRVPPLLLQPLVENAIKHGIEPQLGGGKIEVSARMDDQTLVLTVLDTGAGFSDEAANGSGFGLTQVRERLETLYGASASLTLRRGEYGENGGHLGAGGHVGHGDDGAPRDPGSNGRYGHRRETDKPVTVATIRAPLVPGSALPASSS